MKNHSLLTKKEISKEMIHNILVTINWINEKSNSFFKKFNLSLQQYNVLQVLMEKQEESYALREIQIRMLSKMSNTTRLIDKLKAKGLVVRKHGKINKRKTEIRATKKGLTLLAEIEELLNLHAVEITKNLSIKEVLIINELLDKIRKN